jgi:hypothetical protein
MCFLGSSLLLQLVSDPTLGIIPIPTELAAVSTMELVFAVKGKNILETIAARVLPILFLVFNSTIAALIAGRIYWMGRRYRQAFGHTSGMKSMKVYTSAAAMIVESGSLYATAVLVQIIMTNLNVTYGNESWYIPYYLRVMAGVCRTGLY